MNRTILRLSFIFLSAFGIYTFNSCTREEIVNVEAVTDFTISGGDCVGPCSVTFTNLSTLTTKNEWSFGDGTTSLETSPVHLYTKPGTFTVILTAYDETGQKSVSKTVIIKPNNDPPKSIFSYSASSLIVPATVTFINTSYNATSYLWTFGDGATSTSMSPSHTYPNTGTYKVKLKVTNHISSDSSEKVITVTPPPKPTASFTLTTDGSITPVKATFTNGSTWASSYLWDFGDGTTSTLTSPPPHTYTTVGTYTVKLKCVNISGADSMSKTVNVLPPPPPTASFTLTTDGQVAPVKATFVNNSTGATTYLWSFGDGTTSTLASPSPHTYTVTGTYTVKLKCTNASGSDSMSKTVNVLPPPTSLKITKVSVSAFKSGNWDFLGDPDIYFELNHQGSIIYASTTYNNVTSGDLPIEWGLSLAPFTNFNDMVLFQFWDEDNGSDESMGDVQLTFSNYTSGTNAYPSTATVSMNGFTVTFSLLWQ